MTNILVCDDEKDIVNAISIYLASEEYHVLKAYNGKEALDLVTKEEVSLVILDIMMPMMDGIAAMTKIREISNVPVILLTAKSEDMDKILGLTVGADDYVTKPFNPLELLARVKSQLRRFTKLGGIVVEEEVFMFEGLRMDDKAKEVTVNEQVVKLTPIEYEILKLFLSNPGKVFSSKEIYTKVWNESVIGSESTVAVHIRHLREKIEIDPANPQYLKVVWGRGYSLAVDAKGNR